MARRRHGKTICAIMLVALAACQCASPTPVSGPAAVAVRPAAAGAEPSDPESRASVPLPYSVHLETALLFDPAAGPLNARWSDEPGLHLLAAGEVRNDSALLLDRATLYATLKGAAEDGAWVERHSGGRGFAPPVTPGEPWRAGEQRRFLCVSRALPLAPVDAPPIVGGGALSLEALAADGAAPAGRLAEFSVDWRPAFGVALNKSATAAAETDAACAPQIKKCELKRGEPLVVVYQRGAAFKAVNARGEFRWLGHEQLTWVDEPPPRAVDDAPSGSAASAAVELDGGLRISVRRLVERPAEDETGGKVYELSLRCENLGSRTQRTPAPAVFALDLSGGAYAVAAPPRRETEGSYRSVELKPDQTFDGALAFVAEAGWRPLPIDLELHEPKRPPQRWPLAAGR